MKIRCDFVSNSSSSSFVSINIQSKELKNLLKKFNVPLWKSTETYDVVVEGEDLLECSTDIKTVEELLDFYFDSLEELLGNDISEAYSSYYDNKMLYIESVKKATFRFEDEEYGEFGDDNNCHEFKYDSSKEKK